MESKETYARLERIKDELAETEQDGRFTFILSPLMSKHGEKSSSAVVFGDTDEGALAFALAMAYDEKCRYVLLRAIEIYANIIQSGKEQEVKDSIAVDTMIYRALDTGDDDVHEH